MKEVRVKIDDEELEELEGLLERYDMTPKELLQGFIGDLIDGKYSNGSDERMLAEEYFNRAYWMFRK